MKKIAFLLILICVSGCEPIQYDGATRLVLEGQLVDKNGTPVPNQPIDVMVFQSEDGQRETDQIASGYSSVDGSFQFVIPAPKNNNNISLVINYFDDRYQHKEFQNIRKKDFIDFKFNLNTITLYENSDLSTLAIELIQIDQNHFLSRVEISGLRADEFVEVNPIPTDVIGFYGQINSKVVKNQTVQLNYTVTDYTDINNTVSDDYSIPLSINADDTIFYTLSY